MALPRSCYLFQGLSEQQINGLASIAADKPVEKGQWLFKVGEPAEALYVLHSGAVELVGTVDNGFELPIKILRASGECCGIAALLPPYVYNLSARCAVDAHLLAIKKEAMEDLFRKDARLGLAVMSNMSRHLLDRLNETRRELRIHFKTLSGSADVF